MMRAVLGHATSAQMMRREVLAALRGAHSFAAAHGERQGRKWASAAEELVGLHSRLAAHVVLRPLVESQT
eukprot:1165896-Pyramimonas_sp.AAC.1